MILEEPIGKGNVYGRARLYNVWPCDDPQPLFLPYHRPIQLRDAWVAAGPWGDNLLLYEWGALAHNLFTGEPDGKHYHIAGGYIEFDNSGAPIAPPTPLRNESSSYYSGLTAPQDYLRVPLTATQRGSSGANFPKGNVATFFLQTTGTVGFKNGLTFSDSVNSRVYGVGLIAMPAAGDASQDLIFNRLYYVQANQLAKLAGSQIGITVQVQFQ